MQKQVIIARRDLGMSPGKLAAQVAHASMAFLTTQIRQQAKKAWERESVCRYIGNLFIDNGNAMPAPKPRLVYTASLTFAPELYEGWIEGLFTKIVLEARNRDALMKAKVLAENLGMAEGRDFFLIRDNCLTELCPEERGEDGVGRTLTCIGFAPMEDRIIDQIGSHYQLYRG